MVLRAQGPGPRAAQQSLPLCGRLCYIPSDAYV